MNENLGQKESVKLGVGGVSKCIYIFFRDDMFYPLELKDDNDAIVNAIINNGTTKVEDVNGRLVWKCVC